MSQRNVFLALPEELYAEALETARLREISLSDLLVEALSNSIETQQRDAWLDHSAHPLLKSAARVH